MRSSAEFLLLSVPAGWTAEPCPRGNKPAKQDCYMKSMQYNQIHRVQTKCLHFFLHSSTIISDKYAIFVPFIFFQSTRLQEAIVISIFLLESYLEKYLYASYGFPVMTTSDHCNYPKTCNPLCIFRSTNFTNPQTMYTELLL